jgi:hypothetical protein
MAHESNETKQVKGVVEKVYDKGIKIEGEWYNFSLYDEVEIPSKGDEVEIEVKGKWIKNLTFIGEPKKKRQKRNAVDKDTRITRLALLKISAEMLKTHGRPIEVEEVEEKALRFEDYVYDTREESDIDEDIPF